MKRRQWHYDPLALPQVQHDLPFEVDYSKSERVNCKVCNKLIKQNELRLATSVQSQFDDEKYLKWHHKICFFTKYRPKSTGDIANFDKIKWKDQTFIKEHLENGYSVPEEKSKKGLKRKQTQNVKDFSVEYAKSNRSRCCGCHNFIPKQELRISKLDYEGEKALLFGAIPRWYHFKCFCDLRRDLKFFESGTRLPNFKNLTVQDQAQLKNGLPKLSTDEPSPPKQVRLEINIIEEELKKQNDVFYSIKNKLKHLNSYDVSRLLIHNGQTVPLFENDKMDALVDVIQFGALLPCSECKGQFEFKSGIGYKCSGSISEWALCENVTQDPKRKQFNVPDDLMEKSLFLATHKFEVKKRTINFSAPTGCHNVKKAKNYGPKIIPETPQPFKDLHFALSGISGKRSEELTKEIISLGGFVKSKVLEDTSAVIATPRAVERNLVKIKDAKIYDVHVVSEEFIEEAKQFEKFPTALLEVKSIASWGGDPSTRIAQSIATKLSSRGKSVFEKSQSGTAKLKIKGGGVVDPSSKLENIAHVYQRGKEKFTCTLGLSDIQTKKNSFYKMQILKHDTQSKYWLFRSWGRIGTTIGTTKIEEYSLEECIDTYESTYEEQSGNSWQYRHRFVKKPHKMYPIDIDYGADDDTIRLLDSNIDSKLKKPVQDLLRLIFDVECMKRAMLEYKIDMDKMPLGKLSRIQIKQAFSVLNELSSLIKKGCTDRSKFIVSSNKFYTLIPHNFGVASPSAIDSEELVKSKNEMLESLLEMETVYSILQSKTDETMNPLDSHYEKLNVDIDVLDRTSEEFKMIENYVKNTHASSHNYYELGIEEVYIANRKEESTRYKPFEKSSNRKLLWHGSRTTNFAGILSQGLRIAPPEAPVSGYMFGKGIYFSDMVSKSANYCCTNIQNSTGLLLLCEVALGKMHERYQAEYIEELPKGMNSCWGRGSTQPDPTETIWLKSGVEVPCGRGIPAQLSQGSSLLYNEFIVYNAAQVKVQYLVKLKFKYA